MFSFSSLQHRLRSLSILGIALATIVQLRLLVPGPLTEFSTADNPIAKSNSIWTRFLTFSYLPAVNFKLLLYPSTLSFDWGMDAIPRLNSIFDARNVISMVLYYTLTKTVLNNVRILKNRLIPRVIVQRRVARSKTKKQNFMLSSSLSNNNNNNLSTDFTRTIMATRAAAAATATAASSTVSNQLVNECVCVICKQGLNLRHSSSCRAINNNNVPAPSVQCGCPPFRHSSPSPPPSKKASYGGFISTSTIIKTTKGVTQKSSSGSSRSSSSGSGGSCSSGGGGGGGIGSIVGGYNNHESTPPTAAAILLSIALLALPFLPAANLFFYVGFVVAERILYLPSVGYCLLVGLGVGKMMDPKAGAILSQRKRNAVMVCVCVVLLSFSVKTINRNLDWRNEESLYKSAINVNPPKGNYIVYFVSCLL